MAGSKKSKKVTTKEKKRKKWVQIMAPTEFGNISLGELYLEDASHGMGRLVKLNMLAVTGDPKKQNTVLKFEVTKVEGTSLGTQLMGYAMGPAHVKRMARKSKTKVDDSFVCETKDGKKIRVKTVIIVRAQAAPRSIRTSIRLTTREEVTKRAKGVEYSQFLQQLLRNETQRQLKAELKKIAPIQNFTVRMVKLE